MGICNILLKLLKIGHLLDNIIYPQTYNAFIAFHRVKNMAAINTTVSCKIVEQKVVLVKCRKRNYW